MIPGRLMLKTLASALLLCALLPLSPGVAAAQQEVRTQTADSTQIKILERLQRLRQAVRQIGRCLRSN